MPAPKACSRAWSRCCRPYAKPSTGSAAWRRAGTATAAVATCPLEVSLDLRLADLLGVERQREQLERNTRQFVAGQPANHALLWGPADRQVLSGSCAAGRAGRRRLRLIEIERDHLADLPRVVEQLQGLPQRFVLFCDDLVRCREGDYRVLKSVLDGSLEQAPDNVLLYATSNRRHLVSGEAERQRELEDGGRRAAPQRSGGGQDRLVRPFRPVAVVLSLHPGAFPQRGSPLGGRARGEAGLAWSWSENWRKEAIRWALGRGNRNGRCAYQFSRYWVGKQLLERQA